MYFKVFEKYILELFRVVLTEYWLDHIEFLSSDFNLTRDFKDLYFRFVYYWNEQNVKNGSKMSNKVDTNVTNRVSFLFYRVNLDLRMPTIVCVNYSVRSLIKNDYLMKIMDLWTAILEYFTEKDRTNNQVTWV